MSELRITCIKKSNPYGKHEHITHVGVSGSVYTKETIIDAIEQKKFTFFVQDQRTGVRSEVGVVKPNSGMPYLRTYANGYWNDNLLSLLECY